MKSVLLISVFTVLSLAINGQTLNGFKYVYFPTHIYQNGNQDTWKISKEIRAQFERMGLKTLDESNSLALAPEIREKPCLLLFARIIHSSDPPNAWFNINSNVELDLLDCNRKSVLVYKSLGKGGSIQASLNVATRQITQKLSTIKYKYEEVNTPNMVLPPVESTNETEETLMVYYDSKQLDEIEGIYKSYQSGQIGHYKIGIKKYNYKYKAIIIESDDIIWRPGEVKAIFEPSSMKGFYSAKWYMGNKLPYETFAAIENSAIMSIEFKDPNTGEKSVDKFIKLYPSADFVPSTINRGLKSSGSGFAISTDGVIATNAHVIKDAQRIEVHLNNEFGNKVLSAKVLLKDESNDVALIKIEDSDFKGFNSIPYSILGRSEIGEEVFTIGYPLNIIMGDNYKVTNGIVSSNSGILDDVRFIQITTPIQPGNSGGPLFNKDGNIIGITTARLNEKAVGTSIENVNYALKASFLINLYSMLPQSEVLNKSSSLTGKDLKEQVRVLKNYVCLLKVY